MSTTLPIRPFYVTTAIPYVNAEPHVGFALELLQADVLARYHRQRGRPVRFVTGTDDNSLKNVRAARRAGEPVASFVDRHADAFAALREQLELSNDDFLRTGRDPRHRACVESLWAACEARGDLYESTYSGLYCVGCEQFNRESDLAEGLCPEHRVAPEPIAERNSFFRLSRYRDPLVELIESGRLRIQPEHHRRALLRVLEEGLEDLSVTRSAERAEGWGIRVPGRPDQVIYVWFDALVNYLSALGGADEGPLYETYWGGAGERVHVLGKGITRFHAIIWPAILLSAGRPLPTELLVHGYLTVEGQKIGKSLGNAISPKDLVGRYGCDAVRHYLLRHVHSTGDSDVSETALVQAANTDLADKLGNLASRTTALVRRRRGGLVPGPHRPSRAEEALHAQAVGLEEEIAASVRSFALHEASGAIFRFVDAVNRYVAEQAPWALVKDSSDGAQARFDTVLYTALEALRIIGVQLRPFVPGLAERLLALVGARADSREPGWGALEPGAELGEARALFPRIEQ